MGLGDGHPYTHRDVTRSLMVTDGQVLTGYELKSDAADPEGREGTGLLIEGRTGVVIRGAAIGGYWQNLVLRGCRNVIIDGGVTLGVSLGIEDLKL